MVAQYFVAVPKLYAITEVMTIGPDNYWVLDGALIDYGVAAGTPTTFQIFRYSKESIQLFGEQLYDVSRLGQEIYDYTVNVRCRNIFMIILLLAEVRPAILKLC